MAIHLLILCQLVLLISYVFVYSQTTAKVLKQENTKTVASSSSVATSVATSTSVIHHEHNRCSSDIEKWPEIELFLPLSLRSKNGRSPSEWKDIFIKSLFLFWPLQHSNTSLLAIIDQEVRYTTDAVDAVNVLMNVYSQRISGGTHVKYMPPSTYYGDVGHDRQQLLMFHADEYTKAEYVGFVDSDCLWVTPVILDDLFVHGKPVVNARSGNLPMSVMGESWWHPVAANTHRVIGVNEVMRGMAYFPVIIKTPHLKELRKYIEGRFPGKTFDQIFSTVIRVTAYSQFSIMLNYLFHYHQDDYSWYIHNTTPDWDFKNPPATDGMEADSSVYKKQMRYPKPRVAIHTSYRMLTETRLISNTKNVNDILRAGICFGPSSSSKLYRECSFYSSENDYRTKIFAEMYRYEFFDYTTVHSTTYLQEAVYHRFNHTRTCHHSYTPSDILGLVTPINSSKISGKKMPEHCNDEKYLYFCA